MRLGVDVMGGDLAPAPILEGALAAIPTFAEDDRLVLFGDEAVIRRGIASAGVSDALIEIVATTNEIIMDESPVEAARNKPDSALVQMARFAGPKAGDDRLDMAISAGNTWPRHPVNPPSEHDWNPPEHSPTPRVSPGPS